MIPDFDHNNVLPPFLIDPIARANQSPYLCSTIDLAQKFGTSQERVTILKNFLNFRMQLRRYGMSDNAFQWIDGSFVERVEILRGRPPGDIDVITFFFGYDVNFQQNLMHVFPEFADPGLSKANFSVDHYIVPIDRTPMQTFKDVKYWSMLFTHTKNTSTWKGILEIPLNTEQDDNNAMLLLQNLP